MRCLNRFSAGVRYSLETGAGVPGRSRSVPLRGDSGEPWSLG
jgi:hypothetical protein